MRKNCLEVMLVLLYTNLSPPRLEGKTSPDSIAPTLKTRVEPTFPNTPHSKNPQTPDLGLESGQCGGFAATPAE